MGTKRIATLSIIGALLSVALFSTPPAAALPPPEEFAACVTVDLYPVNPDVGQTAAECQSAQSADCAWVGIVKDTDSITFFDVDQAGCGEVFNNIPPGGLCARMDEDLNPSIGTSYAGCEFWTGCFWIGYTWDGDVFHFWDFQPIPTCFL